MKKLIFSFLFFLILITTSFAQSNYKKIDYLKVSQDEQENFTQVTEELQSSYEEMVKSGDLLSWTLYKVHYPGGEKSGYNFISVATAKSLDIFEDGFSEVATLVPASMGSNGNTDFEKTYSLVQSELWKVENHIPDSDTVSTPSPFMTMDYMNVAPGKGFDYLMLEDEIAKPIHLQRVQRDRMDGWEVYSLIIPGGTDYGYNYATGNYFGKLSHIEFGFTNEIIKQTMGKDSNIPELFNTIYSTRDLVKRELWELVAHTN